MKTQISSKEFFQYWVDFFNQIIPEDSNWSALYDGNYKKWTKETIGLPISQEKNSPFGDFVKLKTGLRYRKEDGLVDLTFAPENNFEGILSLHENPEERIEVLLDSEMKKGKPIFYPKSYSILIEHENDITKCFEEMAKLAYCRARLKVVITYNWNVDISGYYKDVEKILIENFKKIIKQSNEYFPENDKTEYLLIIGNKEGESLIWKGYNFNTLYEYEQIVI